MSQKNAVSGNTALRSDDDTMRVTASRGYYRPAAARPQNIALVPAASGSSLLSKEEDCCSRATD